MTQRLSHEETERLFLGSVVIHPDGFEDVLDILDHSHFSNDVHASIYGAMLECYMERLPLDLVHLGEKLPGITSDLAGMIPDMPTSNLRAYANVVVKNSVRRRLSRDLRAAAQAAEDGEAPDKIISRVDSTICESQSKQVVDFYTTEELTRAVAKSYLSEKKDRVIIPSGFSDLDALLGGGFRPGELFVVAARPAMGKTAFLLNLAVNLAKDSVPTLVFSLEMTAQSLQLRMAQILCGLERHHLDPNNLATGGIEKAIRALDKVSDLPVLINDQSAISTPQMHRVISRAVRRFGIKAVFIDYLQLARGPRGGNDMREREVAEISSAFKSFSKDFNLAVITASQLNRQVEMREDKRPLMSDLRESGSIEQDADIVAMLYRPDYYNPNPTGKTGETELIVGKHRNGPTGVVRLLFEERMTRFIPAPNVPHGGDWTDPLDA